MDLPPDRIRHRRSEIGRRAVQEPKPSSGPTLPSDLPSPVILQGTRETGSNLTFRPWILRPPRSSGIPGTAREHYFIRRRSIVHWRHAWDTRSGRRSTSTHNRPPFATQHKRHWLPGIHPRQTGLPHRSG